MSQRRGTAVLLSAFALVCLALGPLRGIPLDDSWSYARSVERLLSEGRLVISDFASPTVVGHVFWGALFCLPFGYGHAALTVSTLVLALAAVLSLRATALRLGASEERAVAAALLLLLNPLFLPLSCTFMTDVPFLAWSLLALGAYLRWRERRGRIPLWLASASAAWAYLVRQVGLLVAGGLALLAALDRRSDRCAAGTLLALPIAAWLGHAAWFKWVHGPTWAVLRYNVGATSEFWSDPAALVEAMLVRVLASACMLGLFAAPLSPHPFRAIRAGGRRTALAAALLAALHARYGGLPFSGDGSGMVNSYGLGTVDLPGLGYKAAGVFAWGGLWTALTLAGDLSFLALTAAAPRLPGAAKDLLPLMLPSAAMLVGARFYDRYLLGAAAGGLLLAARSGDGRLSPTRWAALAALGAWSLCGTVDYLNWSSAKWRAASIAVGAGFDPLAVSAGNEWAGTHLFEPAMADLRRRKPLAEIEDGEWRRRVEPRVVVSFAPALSAGAPLAEVRYRTPLALAGSSLYLHDLGP